MLTDREKLFKLQTIITLVAVVIIAFAIPDYKPPKNWLKVLIAPFGSVSLVLFSLFVFNQIIKNFHSDPYNVNNILRSIFILCGTIVAICYFIQLVTVHTTLDQAIFYYSVLIGLLVFLYLRIGNIWSMTIITGIVEGAIMYRIFFNQ